MATLPRTPRSWSAEEDEFLRCNYPIKTAAELSLALGRNRNMIYNRARALKLEKIPRWRMTDLKTARTLATAEDGCKLTLAEIGRQLSRTNKGVRAALSRYRSIDLMPEPPACQPANSKNLKKSYAKP